MEFCLAEAVRERHRRFLASACTVSMGMDARQGRLLLRFSGTEPQTLQVRTGTLGLERDYGSGAEACAHAVKVIVERFCSPGVCHPPCGATAATAVLWLPTSSVCQLQAVCLCGTSRERGVARHWAMVCMPAHSKCGHH